jgi:hypothetical protein
MRSPLAFLEPAGKMETGDSECMINTMSNPERAGVMMMKTIHAVWKNGQIIPTQAVDWPEGTALVVEPIEESLVTDPEGDLFGDDPASIARWLAWFDSLEPLNFTHEAEAA